jgi:L-asparaginase II
VTQVEPLVVTTREEESAGSGAYDARSIENVHHGAVAVVSADGGLLHWAGDPHWSTFTRSTLKPFQALSFVRDGGPAHYDWTARQVALLCASHSGEAMHVEVVSSMLASAGSDASQLQCGCHVPGWYAALGTPAPVGAEWSALQHNCSGKHAGFLAACRLNGEPVDDYLSPDAPLQRRIAAAVADVAGLAPHALPRGTDGCSAPNYAMPLSRLAFLYAQLSQGRAARIEGDALGLLGDAMMEHPDLVSGSARSDQALMRFAPGDWVTKIGADGVQAIGIRSAGIGIAIKVADGNRDALFAVVVETLAQLGFLSDNPEQRLLEERGFEPWLRRNIVNARGRKVGRIAPVFALRSA